jgi:hypothetical protein
MMPSLEHRLFARLADRPKDGGHPAAGSSDNLSLSRISAIASGITSRLLQTRQQAMCSEYAERDLKSADSALLSCL